MATRGTTELTPRIESVEELAVRAERTALTRAREEREQRISLSKTLGDRVMNGQLFGMKGFMAIGFPTLSPESQEYRDIELACNGVRWIKPGTVIAVGGRRLPEVYGIKADAGDQGLAFSVRPGENGRYDVAASVLCSRALCSQTSVYTAEMHGSDQEPYGVFFIDTLRSKKVEPVQQIILASESPDGRDRFASGMIACSDLYTQRLIAELAVA